MSKDNWIEEAIKANPDKEQVYFLFGGHSHYHKDEASGLHVQENIKAARECKTLHLT